MKSFEQFKNEITEEEQLQLREYMEKQKEEGLPSAEAVVEYIRGKGYDVSVGDLQPLNDDELENVSGGGDMHPCQWKLTGAEMDDTLYLLWKAHYVQEKCKICGAYRWRPVTDTIKWDPW